MEAIADIVLNRYKTKTDKLIEKHERAIQILEAIKSFEVKKTNNLDFLNGFAGTFQNLRVKYTRLDTIYQMCIDRLKLRYNKIMN